MVHRSAKIAPQIQSESFDTQLCQKKVAKKRDGRNVVLPKITDNNTTSILLKTSMDGQLNSYAGTVSAKVIKLVFRLGENAGSQDRLNGPKYFFQNVQRTLLEFSIIPVSLLALFLASCPYLLLPRVQLMFLDPSKPALAF